MKWQLHQDQLGRGRWKQKWLQRRWSFSWKQGWKGKSTLRMCSLCADNQSRAHARHLVGPPHRVIVMRRHYSCAAWSRLPRQCLRRSSAPVQIEIARIWLAHSYTTPAMSRYNIVRVVLFFTKPEIPFFALTVVKTLHTKLTRKGTIQF